MQFLSFELINDATDPFDNIDIGSEPRFDFADLNGDGVDELIFGQAESHPLRYFVPGAGCQMDEQPCDLNTWVGGIGDWHADDSNWSLMRIPIACDSVVITQPSEVMISTGNTAVGSTLDVLPGANLNVELGALMNIVKIEP